MQRAGGEGEESKHLSSQTKAHPAGRRITSETVKGNYSGHQAHTKVFLTRETNELPGWRGKSNRAGIWTCMLDGPHLFSQAKTNKKNLSIRLAEVSRMQTLRRTRSKGRILPPLATNGSGYSAASLTRCCRTCLSSGYYEFTSYTIDHPESSHYARNMEILQRMNNCEPGNAKKHRSHPDTAGPSCPTPHLQHSTQYPQSRANTVSPFLAISSQFLVPSDHIKLSSHHQCSQMPLWCRLLPNWLILWQ